MFSWRVTKYNPQLRAPNGTYINTGEWTSYSDIGSPRVSSTLTFEEYVRAEDAYVAAIQIFMDCMDVKELYVSDLEKHEYNAPSLK